MDSKFTELFILELLEACLGMTPLSDSGVIEVILSEPTQSKDMYSAFYDVNEKAYVLYKSVGWRREDTEDEIVPTMIEEVERFERISDLCKAVLSIASTEKLIPRLGYIDDLNVDFD